MFLCDMVRELDGCEFIGFDDAAMARVVSTILKEQGCDPKLMQGSVTYTPIGFVVKNHHWVEVMSDGVRIVVDYTVRDRMQDVEADKLPCGLFVLTAATPLHYKGIELPTPDLVRGVEESEDLGCQRPPLTDFLVMIPASQYFH